ncbi:MAG: polyisoprenoid-binding protein [Bacteroidetes bacterium]|nr:MAG: polyisoprenoid-binding protein [Bacteroidota bacterium]
MAITKWSLDPAHSEIQFKVKHLMIATVTGSFTAFDVTAETENDDFTKAKISFTAQSDSINTGNGQRDGHLKSDDFFSAEKFPQIKFEATEYKNDDLYGNLTIRDVTKSVKLSVDFGGIAKDGWGNTKAGFSISGKISRKEFGLQWNSVTEAGGVVVGDEVRILGEIQLAKQA